MWERRGHACPGATRRKIFFPRYGVAHGCAQEPTPGSAVKFRGKSVRKNQPLVPRSNIAGSWARGGGGYAPPPRSGRLAPPKKCRNAQGLAVVAFSIRRVPLFLDHTGYTCPYQKLVCGWKYEIFRPSFAEQLPTQPHLPQIGAEGHTPASLFRLYGLPRLPPLPTRQTLNCKSYTKRMRWPPAVAWVPIRRPPALARHVAGSRTLATPPPASQGRGTRGGTVWQTVGRRVREQPGPWGGAFGSVVPRGRGSGSRHGLSFRTQIFFFFVKDSP